MHLRRLASAFVLTALLTASLVGICKNVLMPGVVNGQTMVSDQCAGHGAAGAHMNHMSGTDHASPICPAASDHMAVFASVFPSTSAVSVFSLLILIAAFALAKIFVTKDFLFLQSRLKVRLRFLERSLSRALAPDCLVFAFSRGILHSKIYA